MNDKDLKNKLSSEQYHILREGGTEAPFTGEFWDDHSAGTFKCRACGTALFSSDTKFDSGTGWPSFTDPVNLKHIELREDGKYGMNRTEVMCKNCGSHLGHLFNDGPIEHGGRRYCINSACLIKE